MPPQSTIVVEIDEVDLAQRIIHVRDKTHGSLKVAFRAMGATVRVPAPGEKWTAVRQGYEWHLERRLDEDSDHNALAVLAPGDTRVSADGALHLDGAEVLANGQPVVTQDVYDDLNVGKIYDFGGMAATIPTKHVAAFGQALVIAEHPMLFERYVGAIESIPVTAGNATWTWANHGFQVGDAFYDYSVSAMRYVYTVIDTNSFTVCQTRAVTAATGAVVMTDPITPSATISRDIRRAPHGMTATTFNVPDLRRMGTVGRGNMGGTNRTVAGHTWANVIGIQAGEGTHVLSLTEMQNHTHAIDRNASRAEIGATSGDISLLSYTASTVIGGNSTVGAYTHSVAAATSGTRSFSHHTPVYGATTGMVAGAAAVGHNSIPPGVVVEKIIYTGV